MGSIDRFTVNNVDYPIDGSNNNYGTCSTAASTQIKVVTVTGVSELYTGSEVVVKFANTNTASSPKLNVNNLGAKDIYNNGQAISAGDIKENRTYAFRYNGTQWDLVGNVGSGGHTIQDENGTLMTQRDILQFEGLEVTDDSTNGKTKVSGNKPTITYETWLTYTDTQKANFNGYVSGVPGGAITSAQSCMLSDGVTSVEDALDNLEADGVGYDNTTSGASATDVQGALDEAFSDLSELEAPISSHDTAVTLSLTSYTAQKDGYIQMYAGASASILVQLYVGGDAVALVGSYGSSASQNYNGMFIRKGTTMVVYNTVGTASAVFVPIS